jgi:hypothetical protein
MCEENRLSHLDVSSTWLYRQLKNFPKCGVRYGTDGNGHGFVLVGPNLKLVHGNKNIVRQKIEAAKIKANKTVNILVIPYQLARSVA